MKNTLKKIYDNVPFKKELFSVLKAIYVPSEKVFRHLHFKGKFKLFIGEKRSFYLYHHGFQLENEIFWKGIRGGWEKESLKLWIDLCKSAEVVLDIGANTGIYALVAKSINPAATVHAFEPIPPVFDKLMKNCRLNSYDIHCHQIALSDYNGKGVVYVPEGDHVYSVTVNKNTTGRATIKPLEIEIGTLAEFISERGIEKIDLIKIDVETHEVEVLKGMKNYVNLFRPDFLIEILNEEVAEGIEELLWGLGYLYFNIDEKGGIRETNRLNKSDFYNYLICKKETAERLKLKNKF